MINKKLSEIIEEIEKLYLYANGLIPKDQTHRLGYMKEQLKETVENAMINTLAEIQQLTELNRTEIDVIKESLDKIIGLIEKELKNEV